MNGDNFMNILSNKELENMDVHNRINYYEQLRDELLKNKSTIKDKSIIRSTTNFVLPYVRNYDLSIVGEDNIPNDTNCLFVINHSNSHDAQTLIEVTNKLGMQQCYLASSEGLSPIVAKLFTENGAILFNRFNKIEANNAFIKFTSNLLNGEYGVIFAEGTWNIHPYKPMHLIKTGPAYSAVISGVPIVPVIFEYIESDKLCCKEKDLYSKCVVTFDKPIYISYNNGLIQQTNSLQNDMEILRKSVWKNYNIKKSNFNDEDIARYLNHTYLKKFSSLFSYDSNIENKVLLVKDQLSSENEYCLNNAGIFAPGIVTKETGKKYVLKNH